jgi:uncharacterized membrane protein
MIQPGNDLSTPRGLRHGPHYDPDAFGRFSEGIARFLGTGRYLAVQTVVVVGWIILNGFLWYRVFSGKPPDVYPFILLNLLFSTQAAYAAPLILLAQNRQTDRDRAEYDRDREMNARSLAQTEYLAREIAALRIALENKVDRDDLEEAVSQITETLERLSSAAADDGGAMRRRSLVEHGMD